jgi:membrane-associated phospholipid phosphatase
MEKLLKKISENRLAVLVLSLYSHLCVILSAALFLITVYSAYLSSVMSAISLALSLAVPFVLVSLLRVVINAPRPYEVFKIFENLPKNKKGRSFPSRHAFSIFAISVTALPVYPVLAAILLLLGIGLCVARVLLGIHFVRDVAAGAVIGIISALLGIIIL